MVPKLPTQKYLPIFEKSCLAHQKGQDEVWSELRRKAEQIFVIPTCAWAVLSAVIRAGVMGVCGVGRHGAAPPWKGSTKDKEV